MIASLVAAALMSGAIPVLPANLPGSTDAMAKAAVADPAAYREVLLNCAAAQGVVAMVKSKAGMSSTGHDQMAITLIHVAGTLPPADEWAASQAYGDKLFAFDQALQNDKTGTVQFDLLKLTQSCAVVEQYADATTAKEMEAAPKSATPANPMFDDKQREDIINELMGIKKDEPKSENKEAAPEPVPAAETTPPAITLLPSEKAIVAGIFADPADEPAGYRDMLKDCMAYHVARGDGIKDAKKRDAAAKSFATFLVASLLVSPEGSDDDGTELEGKVLRIKEALANDATGEAKAELAGIAKTCVRMEPVAQERTDLNKRAKI